MKRKTITIISISILLICAAVCIYINALGKISLKSADIKISYMSEEYNGNIADIKAEYEEIDEDSIEQKIRKNNIFPSDDIKDYVRVGVEVNIKNKSFFPITDITAYLDDEDEDSVIILKSGSLEIEQLGGLKEKNVYLMSLLVY